MAYSNNKEVFYVLLGVGITLLAVVTILSFLTYRKVEYQSWKNENMGIKNENMGIKNENMGIKNENMGVQQELSVVSQIQHPVSNQIQPVVYDERIYRMLEENDHKIHDHLEDVNSNINSLNSNLYNNLKSLNYTYKMPSLGVNNVNVSKAGSVTSIKTSNEDKTRQKEFGMI